MKSFTKIIVYENLRLLNDCVTVPDEDVSIDIKEL
jgi:hypothetical protein